jgi:hypothetical protein
MPTYEVEERFWLDYRQLSREARAQFLHAGTICLPISALALPSERVSGCGPCRGSLESGR